MATETRPDHADPGLRSRVYGGDYERVRAAVARALASMDARTEASEDGRFTARVSSGLGRARLEFRLEELETGEVQVDGRAVREGVLALPDRAMKAALARIDREMD